MNIELFEENKINYSSDRFSVRFNIIDYNFNGIKKKLTKFEGQSKTTKVEHTNSFTPNNQLKTMAPARPPITQFHLITVQFGGGEHFLCTNSFYEPPQSIETPHHYHFRKHSIKSLNVCDV